MKMIGTLCALPLCLAGCFSMSGLSGSSSEFACKAPSGVTCQSVSGVYANSRQGNLPSQRAGKDGEEGERRSKSSYFGAGEEYKVTPRAMTTLSSGEAIRTAPIVLRVWMAPWEDRAGDLHDQSYFYTVVDQGKWKIDANRASIQTEFMPIFSTQKQAPAPAANQPPAGSRPQPLVSPAEYSNLGLTPQQGRPGGN